jgi:signal peptidase I
MTPNDGFSSSPVAPTLPGPAPLTARKPNLMTHPKNGPRELVETVVFVVVLVLLLRSFVAEAFVIPTGSMAETLLGWRAYVTCRLCGDEFPINVSEEVAPNRGPPERVSGCTCPNCRLHMLRDDNDKWVRAPALFNNSGDRVLVAKWPMQEYRRWDVVVFKYPKEPQLNWEAMNYIKRLIGMPGETIAIMNGDLYVCDDVSYDDAEQPTRELDRWWKTYMYVNADAAREAFRAGRFRILRKPPAQMLTMRRLVYDNDHQPADLVGVVPPRWDANSGWKRNDDKKPTEFTVTEDAPTEHWLTYHHYAVHHGVDQPTPTPPFSPELIKNFMGYNYVDTNRVDKRNEDQYWVGDLMVECDVDVTAGSGEFAIELSKGPDRFQARFDLSTGNCRLVRVGKISSAELGKAQTKLKGTGKHFVRFANFDERLTLWVDSEMPFGDGVEYSGQPCERPEDEPNNRQPASFGTLGGARLVVKHLKLYRDTYYTAAGHERFNRPAGDPEMTMFVQPGHYLCLGDNSTQSSDGRDWGVVPERLMQGKAQMVYFPFWPWAHRFGPIR